MERAEWRERYIVELMDRTGCDRKLAEENFEAADDHDFDDDPEYAAADEASYWAD